VKLTKATVRPLNGLTREPFEVEGKLTPSGRWGVYKRVGTTGYSVFHVATGLRALDVNKLSDARDLLTEFEELETPNLDAAPFGQLPKMTTGVTSQNQPYKAELLALRDAIQKVRGSFKVSA
jgi:hypothetical protein